MKTINLEQIATVLKASGGTITVERLKNIINGFDIVSIDRQKPATKIITTDEINNLIRHRGGMPVDDLVKILSAYDVVEASPKKKPGPVDTKKTIPSNQAQEVTKNFIIDYLKTSILKGKRIWCDYSKFDTGPACTIKETNSIIKLLQSDQFIDDAIQLEKGDEAAGFQMKMPKEDYERTKCFYVIIKKNHREIIQVQYY